MLTGHDVTIPTMLACALAYLAESDCPNTQNLLNAPLDESPKRRLNCLFVKNYTIISLLCDVIKIKIFWE
ncbi:MAG: hypothetical protein DDG59_07305 [Anaerolineae bacterium]|nr:MAG: hypothetical protein DDG59_07305 [Anaerolineae bacterium]